MASQDVQSRDSGSLLLEVPSGSKVALGSPFADTRGKGFLKAPEKAREPELKLSHKGLGL